MYSLRDVASFAVDEFRRGLEGLTSDEAVWRAPKADRSQMNAISWTVQHVGAHWHTVAYRLQGLPPQSYRPHSDGTAPPFGAAMAILDAAAADLMTAVEGYGDEARRPVREDTPETVSQH